MIEKCGCKVTVDPKTQFETVEPCDKHNTWKRFGRFIDHFFKRGSHQGKE